MFGLVGLLAGQEASAVEGGTGAYFLGSRDTLSGIVPPPGTYLSTTYDNFSGEVEGISVGGLPVRANASVDLDLVRLGWTQSFRGRLWGGQPAFNLNVPIPNVSLSYTAVTPPFAGAQVNDTSSGIGDLSLTGLLGWSSGNLHYSAGLTLYVPTGDYDVATISVPTRSIEAVSVGKNVWSLQPTFAATWLNPETGFEVSGAASFLFSTKNNDTDYQTAPAFQFESAIVQRTKSGWGFGLTAYAYQQLSDDSGTGADLTRAFLAVDSLEARVYGVGPLLVYEGAKLFGSDVSLKAKYVSEFGAKRRLESDVFTFSLSLVF